MLLDEVADDGALHQHCICRSTWRDSLTARRRARSSRAQPREVVQEVWFMYRTVWRGMRHWWAIQADTTGASRPQHSPSVSRFAGSTGATLVVAVRAVGLQAYRVETVHVIDGTLLVYA